MSSLIGRIPYFEKTKNRVRTRFFKFIDRNIPARDHHVLSRKKLYILPTRRGFLFLFLVLVLWLLGTNYQNNLILGLSFLMVSMFIVSILHTHANLSQLKITSKGVLPVFADSTLYFSFAVQSLRKRDTENLSFNWQGQKQGKHSVSIYSGETELIKVPFRASARGIVNPGRLLVQSVFPLGLFRCWTWLNWDVGAIVYPKPSECELNDFTLERDEGEGLGAHPSANGEDFSNLREYYKGDTIKHIAWKTYARGQGLYTKEFSQNVAREIWLDFDKIPVLGEEEKLSGLCYWVLHFADKNDEYGVKLPDQEISPSRGENHKKVVLESLALFGR